MSDVIDHEDTYEAAMERRLSRFAKPSVKGKWTVPGGPWPSSHLLVFDLTSRCGRIWDGRFPDGWETDTRRPIDEPPATGKTCETCLRLSRRDG